MTRKDQMRKGFVARTFHIPVDLDDKLRIEAVKKRIRFSDMAILAFETLWKSFPFGAQDSEIRCLFEPGLRPVVTLE